LNDCVHNRFERLQVRPQSQSAKHLGGSEDLVYELGGEPTPLAKLRPPSGPPSALSRTDLVAHMRDPAGVRHGYTHRERAVLWGTSLAQVAFLKGQLGDHFASHILPTTDF